MAGRHTPTHTAEANGECVRVSKRDTAVAGRWGYCWGHWTYTHLKRVPGIEVDFLWNGGRDAEAGIAGGGRKCDIPTRTRLLAAFATGTYKRASAVRRNTAAFISSLKCATQPSSVRSGCGCQGNTEWHPTGGAWQHVSQASKHTIRAGSGDGYGGCDADSGDGMEVVGESLHNAQLQRSPITCIACRTDGSSSLFFLSLRLLCLLVMVVKQLCCVSCNRHCRFLERCHC